jgi:hypothetical protein
MVFRMASPGPKKRYPHEFTFRMTRLEREAVRREAVVKGLSESAMVRLCIRYALGLVDESSEEKEA